jgi:hypothetical protein
MCVCVCVYWRVLANVWCGCVYVSACALKWSARVRMSMHFTCAFMRIDVSGCVCTRASCEFLALALLCTWCFVLPGVKEALGHALLHTPLPYFCWRKSALTGT